MNLKQIPDCVTRFSAERNLNAGGMANHRRICRRTFEQGRYGRIKTVHSMAAFVLLLHDMGTPDRTVEFKSQDIDFVMLTKADFLALTTHQLN